MTDYESALERAMKRMPPVRGDDTRFVIPEARVFQEGKTTILENFAEIVDILNRDPDHVMKFLLRELGTAGRTEGGRAVFQGRFTNESIDAHIKSYVEEYVICSECNRPDTHLVKSDRTIMLKCDACGAHRPVRKRKVRIEAKRDAVEEGETYEVRIDAIGSKGDGIAKRDKYTIFVPNVKKGDIVKIRIKKVSGTLAFSELIERK